MAAVVASKVKRNRSAKHSNNQGGTIQLEIDRNGKLRKIDRAEEAAAKKRTKLRTTGYYRKVRASEQNYTVFRPLSCDVLLSIFDMFHRPVGGYCSYNIVQPNW